MERTATAVMATAVRSGWRARICDLIAVIRRHAQGHLGADGQHDHERKPPNYGLLRKHFLAAIGASSPNLEKNLRRDLHLTWRSGVDHLTEQVAADVAVHGQGAEKVSVIESVESFQTELQDLRFADLERL
jgi:hypothetical protein